MSRFSFFPDSILSRADEVKLCLRKVRGRVHVAFEISGDVGPSVFDDDDEEGTAQEQVDAVLFARSLMVEFACSSKGGAS